MSSNLYFFFWDNGVFLQRSQDLARCSLSCPLDFLLIHDLIFIHYCFLSSLNCAFRHRFHIILLILIILKYNFSTEHLQSGSVPKYSTQHRTPYLKVPWTLSHQNMLCTIIIKRLEGFSCSWIPSLPSGRRFLLAAFHNLMITEISSIHWILSQVPGISNFCFSFQGPQLFSKKCSDNNWGSKQVMMK